MDKTTDVNGVEVLCIGTELLLGSIANTNAMWIANELALLGLPHYRQTVVGDNIGRLTEVILEASNRTRILITTGGLGPTPDDLTTQTIAGAFNTPLEENSNIWIDIQEKLKNKGFKPSKNNFKQAFIPKGAQIIPNPTGTAPGIIWSPKNDFTILTFPGVPSEMKRMWQESALPWLRKYGGINQTIISRTLRLTGIAESTLAEKIDDLFQQENPTVAPYANLGEVKLRITARASNTEKALKLIKPCEKEILSRVEQYCFGFDEESLPLVVLKLLSKRNETLCVAESCSGGGLAASLTAIAGASETFLGGIIAYNNSVKETLLAVSQQTLATHGAVSEPVVKAMAKGAREKLNADWAIAITGIAGPTGEEKNKPLGLVHFAVAGSKGIQTSQINLHKFKGREAIQKSSVIYGLNFLRMLLLARS